MPHTRIGDDLTPLSIDTQLLNNFYYKKKCDVIIVTFDE